MSKTLFKEAIADARAVKETAIESAKAALEEAFTPHLKSMFAAKLETLAENDDYLGEEEMKDEMQDETQNEAAEMDLEEILRELAELEESENSNKIDEEADEALEEEETEGIYENEDKEEESEEDFDIEDLSAEDLKELVVDIMVDLGLTSAEEAAKLKSKEAGDDEMEMGDDEMGEEEETETEVVDEIDLNELLAEIELLEKKNKKKAMKDEEEKEKDEEDKETKKLKEDLQEAMDSLNELKNELDEVNLLNAKLLYTNKIFKAKNLSETQKIKVLSTFDKASSVKEVKLVYETLSEGLTTSTEKKSPIKESLGSASKAMGMAPKKPIIESNEVFARMQRLAGIN
jgi:hypothetical protein